MPADALIRTGMEHPALFGKLPGHGDFVSRGVPGGLRDRLDQWLSDWLAAARAQHGAAFVDAYEAAAPWLFESARTVAVLLPSVDAVGRHYPLLALAAPGTQIQAVYDAMVDALNDVSDSDTLRRALAALVPAEAGAAPESGAWFLPEGAEPLLPAPDSLATWALVEGCFQ